MLYLWAADLLIVIHFSFILFVIFGALLLFKWPKLIWLHLPAAVWGALIEFYHWVCPLTEWEHVLRQGSDWAYEGSFIGHYLIPLIYPPGLTPEIQLLMGAGVVVINLSLYSIWVKKHWFS